MKKKREGKAQENITDKTSTHKRWKTKDPEQKSIHTLVPAVVPESVPREVEPVSVAYGGRHEAENVSPSRPLSALKKNKEREKTLCMDKRTEPSNVCDDRIDTMSIQAGRSYIRKEGAQKVESPPFAHGKLFKHTQFSATAKASATFLWPFCYVFSRAHL